MTMEEIKKRLTEIAAEIEQLGDAITEERLTALEKEARELLDKQEAMKNAAEQRQNLLASIAEGRTAGTVLRSIGTIGDVQQRSNEESDPYATPEYRRAFQNYVMRGAEIPAEFRADATTKTSDAGAVIPTNIVNRVVEKNGAVRPYFDRGDADGIQGRRFDSDGIREACGDVGKRRCWQR